METTVDVRAAVAAAIRAPSMHNSQPWRFRLRNGGIEIRLDPDRLLPATDPTGWAARLAGGAALLNLRLAVATQGWAPKVRVLPDRDDPDLLAVLTADHRRAPTPTERQLASAVWRRRSHRAAFWPDPVPAAARSRLVAAAHAEGGWLELLIGPGPVNAVAELAQAANQLLMRQPAYLAELASWSRFDGPGADGEESRDGVPPEAAGPASQPDDLLPSRPYGEQPAGTGRDLGAHPVVAVLGTVGDTPGDQIVAGQALQRVLLTATDERLATAMVSQPVEVPGIREQLRLALGQPGAPQMLLRVGYGVNGPPARRRPVEEVIDAPTAGVPSARDLRPGQARAGRP